MSTLPKIFLICFGIFLLHSTTAYNNRRPQKCYQLRGGCRGFPIKKEPFYIGMFENKPYECCCINFRGMCSREFSPVCGTDGITYANKCLICRRKGFLRYHRDMRNPLMIRHVGSCSSKTKT